MTDKKTIDSIKARLGSIPKSYLDTLRPSVKQLITVDLPRLIRQVEELTRKV